MRNVIGVSCVLFALVAVQACRQRKVQSASAPPLTPVSVARAMQESVPTEVRVVGTVEPSSIVEVKSQVAGQMLRVGFEEGQTVAKGVLLFEIDSRPFREDLRQAEAALSRDRAQQEQAEANLARDIAQAKYADADASRYAELSKAGVVARAQYDQVRTSAEASSESVRASRAAIGTARAAMESDGAAIDKAKLDISYCEIHAPISGRTGNLLVHPGNLVKANDVPLVVIHQVSPIFVSFSVPDEHLAAVRRLNARRTLPVHVTLQDGSGRSAAGRLTLIDNAVDTSTGTIRLKAEFGNRDGALWPGQFVNVTLTLDTIANATVIPSEAVQAGQQGQFVYVVKQDQTVEPRVVTAGAAFSGKVVIEKGVQPGETVVTDGQLRLFPGARIQVVDASKIGGPGL